MCTKATLIYSQAHSTPTPGSLQESHGPIHIVGQRVEIKIETYPAIIDHLKLLVHLLEEAYKASVRTGRRSEEDSE